MSVLWSLSARAPIRYLKFSAEPVSMRGLHAAPPEHKRATHSQHRLPCVCSGDAVEMATPAGSFADSAG